MPRPSSFAALSFVRAALMCFALGWLLAAALPAAQAQQLPKGAMVKRKPGAARSAQTRRQASFRGSRAPASSPRASSTRLKSLTPARATRSPRRQSDQSAGYRGQAPSASPRPSPTRYKSLDAATATRNPRRQSKQAASYRGSQAPSNGSRSSPTRYKSLDGATATRNPRRQSSQVASYRGLQAANGRSNASAGRRNTAGAQSLQAGSFRGVRVSRRPAFNTDRQRGAYTGNVPMMGRSNQMAGRRSVMAASDYGRGQFRGNQRASRANRQMGRTQLAGRGRNAPVGCDSDRRLNSRYRELAASARRDGGGSTMSRKYLRQRAVALGAGNRTTDQQRASFRGTQLISERSNRTAGRRSVMAASDYGRKDYRGFISTRGARSRDRRIAKNNRAMANYRGTIRTNTRRPKGAFPGATYRGGSVRNEYTARAKDRARMMKRLNKNKRLLQPNYQRQKEQKPTYDSRESEIWAQPSGGKRK